MQSILRINSGVYELKELMNNIGAGHKKEEGGLFDANPKPGMNNSLIFGGVG